MIRGHPIPSAAAAKTVSILVAPSMRCWSGWPANSICRASSAYRRSGGGQRMERSWRSSRLYRFDCRWSTNSLPKALPHMGARCRRPRGSCQGAPISAHSVARCSKQVTPAFREAGSSGSRHGCVTPIELTTKHLPCTLVSILWIDGGHNATLAIACHPTGLYAS